mmetsp:Transcript_14089/g.20595  ORF Transcript_14089/g.20595 Transcript_14089/m.20595 type:complete len:103 (+) Transcript_14089:3165-3473(+)
MLPAASDSTWLASSPPVELLPTIVSGVKVTAGNGEGAAKGAPVCMGTGAEKVYGDGAAGKPPDPARDGIGARAADVGPGINDDDRGEDDDEEGDDDVGGGNE